MNKKRILSTALLVVMLVSTIFAAIPFTASAAYSDSSASASSNVPAGYIEANLNSEQLKAYIDEYLSYDFTSVSDMLTYELEKGYLYYSNSTGKTHTIFVNKYTGFVYYVNNTTGQILTSNPISPSNAKGTEDKEVLMSQVLVKYAETANTTNTKELNSARWAARNAQISVTPISGGLRVSYTLGDTSTRFLLPGLLLAEDFEGSILMPMIDTFIGYMEEYCTEKYPDTNFAFVDNEEYKAYDYGCINSSSRDGLKRYFTDMQAIYQRCLTDKNSAEYIMIDTLRTDIMKVIGAYALNVPEKYLENVDRYKENLETMYKDYPITKTGVAVYAYSGSNLPEAKRPLANIIKKNCSEYTFSMMFEHETKSGYVANLEQNPVFRCALEYTFNSDGSLSVRLPASSIVFDETVYTLEMITPLQYFGGSDMKNDGYVFYPDGSGTVIEFEDFYNDAKTVGIELSAPIYGIDYCYSKIDSIKGISHREQVTMPVYGVVNEVKASDATNLLYGSATVTNGYFAILEEGSALATLMVKSGGMSHNYIGAYAYYTPYPSDVYDLSETLSVGSLGIYKIVSKSKYAGSYVTRYVMLTDDEIGSQIYGENAYYASDYVGMASYYREYLKGNGVLTALENLNEALPLYIEVLGAMDITTKFLSFPVTKSIPLTTFDNVAQMYDELSKCVEFVKAKAAEYKALAEKEENDLQRYQYQQQAERYAELDGKIQNITNINFKLTGFANGGMSATYPAKVKWAKACGGKSDFKSLVKKANEISTSGANFSLYPEFDFMYINKTAPFDGVSSDDDASVMVDNRYASKQIYNSVSQEFESFFTLVVSPDSIAKLYSKFNKKYSGYKNSNISISTMGSTLNSNFDKENPINREEAREMIENVLDTMANKNGYNIMTDKGNIYAVEYATHILNAPIDSSHHRYTSYTVPFSALVLHSYVNYTGEPINYSGSPAYDRLRAIESGAALYYIVCFQNTSYMKDDEDLSDYFGVDYHNWFDDIVENYKVLNDLIGDLQYHEIVDHEILIAERQIESEEMALSYLLLQNEIIGFLDAQLREFADSSLASLKGDGSNYDKRIKLVVDTDALMGRFSEILNLSIEDLRAKPSDNELSFSEKIDNLVNEYTSFYSGAETTENTVVVTFSEFEYGTEKYMTQYSYITDSCATDKDYVYTDYTIDNGNVTMVTYQNGDSVVRFILNYNNFEVTVRLSATESYTLEAYGCHKITN